jgi:hypothetical protein
MGKNKKFRWKLFIVRLIAVLVIQMPITALLAVAVTGFHDMDKYYEVYWKSCFIAGLYLGRHWYLFLLLYGVPFYDDLSRIFDDIIIQGRYRDSVLDHILYVFGVDWEKWLIFVIIGVVTPIVVHVVLKCLIRFVKWGNTIELTKKRG